MNPEIINTTPDCEIVASRVVNAPVELVFRSWTEPKHLKTWWGPAGFTNTINEYDLRPGERWTFIMHGPDKGNHPNECEFVKIDKPFMLVWNHLSKPAFQFIANFDKLSDDTTRVTFKLMFETVDLCNKVRAYAPEKNEENLDKLEVELEKMKKTF